MPTEFRDLNIGDTFDFISGGGDSYFKRCTKLSARTYAAIEHESGPTMRVGSINVAVYHVEKGARL